MKKVMVVAVHPDDETLGCGGTLLKHKALGDEIFWCIVTKMDESIGFKRERILRRNEQIRKVSREYGFKKVFELGFPTTQIYAIDKVNFMMKIGETFKEARPEVLYLPFFGDIHSDHRISFQAAISCTKWFRFPFIKEIFAMETLSETEFSSPGLYSPFVPNTFVDISEHFERKIRILKNYKEELLEHPFPRSIDNVRALAMHRGATSGCRFAESFMMLKRVIS